MIIPRLHQQLLGELTQLKFAPDELVSACESAEESVANFPDFCKYLNASHGVSNTVILYCIGRIRRMPIATLARFRFNPEYFTVFSQEVCKSLRIVPLFVSEDFASVATGFAFDPSAISQLQDLAGARRVITHLALDHELNAKIAQLEKGDGIKIDDVLSSLDQSYSLLEAEAAKEKAEESGPIVQLANKIIEDAFYSGTSDIHIDPYEKETIIRYRVDGLLKIILRLPGRVGPPLVARLKIMCNMDIAERRLPQDGRIVFKNFTKQPLDIDLRVSTAPLNHGEGVVMRILDKQKSTLPLPDLGFTEHNLKRYRQCIREPYGMVLNCGPTGSGKSMTLYSALNEVNTEDVCIRTAEDPIEYTLDGINQMQMHKGIGLTFATALRAFLRQDPDIILVGEIRDTETANIAVEAALTGHLLISTLHTNDAPSTIARLVDMGIEPFMVSSSLLCVCAQRLLRRVCKRCRVPYEPEGREKQVLESAIGWSGKIFRASQNGCSTCNATGYKGRVGIHELMVNNEELTVGINRGLDTAELKKICMKTGMMTLHQDSMEKVKMGLTTMTEALSTVPVDS